MRKLVIHYNDEDKMIRHNALEAADDYMNKYMEDNGEGIEKCYIYSCESEHTEKAWSIMVYHTKTTVVVKITPRPYKSQHIYAQDPHSMINN